MALAFQGFTIKNSLAESFFDRAIFDNLAGIPVGSDIALLVNNKRNSSSLTITGSNISGSSIIVPGSLAVFSNRTRITIDNSTVDYYVKNSNGVDTFQLSTVLDLSNTVDTPPTGIYTRSDAISLSNISNFSSKRRKAVVGGILITTNDLLGGVTPKALLSSLEANLAFYKFRTLNSLNKTTNFLGRKLLKTNGLSIIKDPDGVIQSQGITDTGPGLFIYNAATNSGVRAFSSNANPWSDSGNGYLQSTALQITVGKLTISNSSNLVLEAKAGASLSANVSPPQSLATSFTHKLPIIIDGETYFLCLKLAT